MIYDGAALFFQFNITSSATFLFIKYHCYSVRRIFQSMWIFKANPISLFRSHFMHIFFRSLIYHICEANTYLLIQAYKTNVKSLHCVCAFASRSTIFICLSWGIKNCFLLFTIFYFSCTSICIRYSKINKFFKDKHA